MAPSIGLNLRVTGHCNQGGRKYMEDAFVVAYQQSEDGKDLEYAYFGIFDGHGGKEAALFAKEHLMNNIVSQKTFWSDDDEQVLKAIRDGFLLTHRAMWKEVGNWPKTISGLPSTSGTTSSIAFIRKRKLYIGHVGDSKIVIGCQESGTSEWTSIPLTRDHKPETPKEKQRIYSVGGLVINKAGVERVVWNRPRPGHKGPVRRSTPFDQIPFLAVARSLGDLWSYNYLRKEFVVSPDPDVAVCSLDPRRDRCIIFASDGLWNMLTAKSAVRIVQKAEEENEKIILEGGGPNGVGKPSNNPSKLLVDCALNHWFDLRMRADNTSVVTVMLDPPGPPKCEVLLRQKVMQKLRPRDEQYESTSPSPGENSSDKKITAEKCAELLYWAKEPHRRTLGEACKHGDILIVKKFLDEGANVNEVMKDGKSLLAIASANGHLGVVGLLLSRGAEADNFDEKGQTAIMEAADAGHIKIVKLLVQHGSNVKSFDDAVPLDSVTSGVDEDSTVTPPDSLPHLNNKDEKLNNKDKRKPCNPNEPQSLKERKRPAEDDDDSGSPNKELRLSSELKDIDIPARKGLPKPVILSPRKIFRRKSSPPGTPNALCNSTKPSSYPTSLIDVRSKKKGHEPPGEAAESKDGRQEMETDTANHENISNKANGMSSSDSKYCNSLQGNSHANHLTKSVSSDTIGKAFPSPTLVTAERTVSGSSVKPSKESGSPSTVSKCVNVKENGRVHLCEVDNIVPVDYNEKRNVESSKPLNPAIQRIRKKELRQTIPSTRSATRGSTLSHKKSYSDFNKTSKSLRKLKLHRNSGWKSRSLVGYRTVSLRKDLPHITRAQNRIRKLKL